MRGSSRPGRPSSRQLQQGRKGYAIQPPALPCPPLQPFFEAMHLALAPGGIVCTQAESLWYHLGIIKSLAAMCAEVFAGGAVQYAFTTIPTYPRWELPAVRAGHGACHAGECAMHAPMMDVLCGWTLPICGRSGVGLPGFARPGIWLCSRI